jgi:hypothetical protein
MSSEEIGGVVGVSVMLAGVFAVDVFMILIRGHI